MKTKQVKLELDAFELSEVERVERAKEASRLCRELDKLEEDFKESRATWRQRIKHTKDLRDAKNLAFETGTEKRVILADESIDWDARVATYTHDGKVIRTRPLDPAEQQGMFDEEDAPHTDVEKEMAAEEAKEKEAQPKKRTLAQRAENRAEAKGPKLNKNGFPIIEQKPASEAAK